jgi:endonuclease/exonuclease/phosphatase family metal-dependent hydrolase
MIKIAAFNVENLFDRAKALNEDSETATRIIKQEAELNILFKRAFYTEANKARMLELMKELGILKTDEGPYVYLRKIKGPPLIKRPKTGSPEIVATGRDAWVGWVELKTVHVNDIAVMNTGRVLRDVDADIVAVVEAEHRIALKQFSDYVIKEVGGTPYPNIMLIDGNDERGIDVGLMTKAGFAIGAMHSHVHDRGADKSTIFSRDCPEYCVETPTGENIWVLPNHFKSKFGGNDPRSKAKRMAQATRTAEIYNKLLSRGEDNIVVLGDLNDGPTSAELQPLLAQTNLKDVSEHPTFATGEYAGKGTFGGGNDKDKIDYLLLSPALFNRVSAAGLFRKGAWPGKRPKKWMVFDELTEEVHAASDHHLIWCEIA